MKRIFFDTVVLDAAQLSQMARTLGASQLLAGTDYPYDMEESRLIDFVYHAGLTESDTQAILGLNAARLLDIDAEAALARARSGARTRTA